MQAVRVQENEMTPKAFCQLSGVGPFQVYSISAEPNEEKRSTTLEIVANVCELAGFLTKYAAQSHTTVMEGSKFEPKRQRHRIGPWRWNVGRHKVPNSAAAAAATVVAVGSKRKR